MTSHHHKEIVANVGSLDSCLKIIDSVEFFDAAQAKEMTKKAEQIQALWGQIDRLSKVVAAHTDTVSMSTHEKFAEKVNNHSPVKSSIAQSTIQRLKKPISRPELDSDDEDVQEEEFNYVNKDPLTKGPINKPVKNKICGHVYDADTILIYIKDLEKKKFLRQCPQSGCNNKKNLIMTDMQDFPEFYSLCK